MVSSRINTCSCMPSRTSFLLLTDADEGFLNRDKILWYPPFHANLSKETNAENGNVCSNLEMMSSIFTNFATWRDLCKVCANTLQIPFKIVALKSGNRAFPFPIDIAWVAVNFMWEYRLRKIYILSNSPQPVITFQHWHIHLLFCKLENNFLNRWHSRSSLNCV